MTTMGISLQTGDPDIFVLPAITVRHRHAIPSAPSHFLRSTVRLPAIRRDTTTATTTAPTATREEQPAYRPRPGTAVNCPICLEGVAQNEAHVTPCGHHYHQRCMREMEAHGDVSFFPWFSVGYRNLNTIIKVVFIILSPSQLGPANFDL